MSPIGRLLTWLAHEYIVPRLAANKSFQQFAVKLDNFLQSQQQSIKSTAEAATKQSQEVLQAKTKPILEDPDVKELIEKFNNTSVIKNLSGVYASIRNEYAKEFSSKKRS
jgi:hypothetical protein